MHHLESHISVGLGYWCWDTSQAGFQDYLQPSDAAHPDSHFLVNSLGCLINSGCFNPGMFLIVKRMKIKYKSQLWVLWCVSGLEDKEIFWRREQKQTAVERVCQSKLRTWRCFFPALDSSPAALCSHQSGVRAPSPAWRLIPLSTISCTQM